MIGDKTTQYCSTCNATTNHEQGCFKSKEIKGELFHLDSTFGESLQKTSSGFKDYVIEEHNDLMTGDDPTEYAQSLSGSLNLDELFASQVRAMKCVECGHLIKLGRLP